MPLRRLGVTLKTTFFGRRRCVTAAAAPQATYGQRVSPNSHPSQLSSGASTGRSRPRRRSSAVSTTRKNDMAQKCSRKAP